MKLFLIIFTALIMMAYSAAAEAGEVHYVEMYSFGNVIVVYSFVFNRC